MRQRNAPTFGVEQASQAHFYELMATRKFPTASHKTQIVVLEEDLESNLDHLIDIVIYG